MDFELKWIQGKAETVKDSKTKSNLVNKGDNICPKCKNERGDLDRTGKKSDGRNQVKCICKEKWNADENKLDEIGSNQNDADYSGAHHNTFLTDVEDLDFEGRGERLKA